MAPEWFELFDSNVTIETVLKLYEQDIRCTINDGQVSEVIFREG